MGLNINLRAHHCLGLVIFWQLKDERYGQQAYLSEHQVGLLRSNLIIYKVTNTVRKKAGMKNKALNNLKGIKHTNMSSVAFSILLQTHCADCIAGRPHKFTLPPKKKST